MQLTTFETATSDEHKEAIQDSLETMENGERHSFIRPPSLKIIGYDPRSKRKTTYIAQPAAILEVAGGIHSPYLDPSRRKELAKIACDSLALKFSKNAPPQLVMAWSGSSKEFAAAATAVAKSRKWCALQQSLSSNVQKLFRTALVIGKVECVVTLYNQAMPKGGAPEAPVVNKQLVVNIYSRAASEATELIITDEEQVQRIGRTITSFPDGEIRSAAVRRLLRYIHCDVIPDMESDDIDRKVLHVVLRPARKDFLTETLSTSPETTFAQWACRQSSCPSILKKVLISLCARWITSKSLTKRPQITSSLFTQRVKRKVLREVWLSALREIQQTPVYCLGHKR